MKHPAKLYFRYIFALILPAAAAVAQTAASNDICLSCHEDQGKKVSTSAHASVSCAQCHVKHDDYPHPQGVPKPACAGCHATIGRDYAAGVHGQAVSHGNQAAPECGTCHGAAHEAARPRSAEFRKAVPDTCGMCHSDVADQFKSSVHGKALARGVLNAPVCTDCHGEHQILKPGNAASTVNPNHIRDTCGQCHGDVRLARRLGLPADRLTTFDASFHGLALKEGQQSVANCASCHGVHNILPSSDPKAMTNAKNLPATCGHCHAGAGTRFALGRVHEAQGDHEPYAIAFVRMFYLLVIPGTIGFMILHNLGDWFRKLLARRFGRDGSPPQRPGTIRMYPFERLSHGLMLISFIVLGWTGFALKFPDHWWAQPLLVWPEMRRWVHRGAAILFMIVAVMHFGSLILNPQLRKHWKVLIPRWRDVPEAIRMTMYNLGLSDRKPIISPHSYIEKAEYWAVVWGSIVMVLTGGLLWANTLALHWLPKSVLDISTVVHWYEAILATLAIVVWHLYSVILDPDVYPLDTAFLNGRTVRVHIEEEDEAPVA
ncbi:MAG TPA: cytochrome b/b6 domain-containing protein [Bryobacteraceae bacterium]|nr:cytochrome b/b6 domain-containing protein [Bryobacteraceae bacterium]